MLGRQARRAWKARDSILTSRRHAGRMRVQTLGCILDTLTREETGAKPATGTDGTQWKRASAMLSLLLAPVRFLFRYQIMFHGNRCLLRVVGLSNVGLERFV
jgi:hypothetical protein